ncbi:MAG TPA: triple tyrosine motif-containing protein [Candidatus Acidoferrales bacterium]|nr:triple tyrosine motif-containing protein [Candidatus Acidoferrales bacterium]
MNSADDNSTLGQAALVRPAGAEEHRDDGSTWVWTAKLRRMLFHVFLMVGIVPFACQWGMAQPSSPRTQRIIHESWTFRDGAPEQVVTLAQTADGFLWVGAPTGLFRFDGLRFEPFRSSSGNRLLSTYVFGLFASPSGGLWVGYAFGGFSFIKNGQVRNFDLNTGSVYGFAQDKNGVVWAATSGGLWRFDASGWQHITADWDAPLHPVCQVRFDHDGTLWVLTDSLRPGVGKGLFYLPPGAKQFRKAGENLFIEGFTLDSDNMVLTTREPTGLAGSGVKLGESLPAYPILKKDAEQMLDRNSGVWSMLKSAQVLRHPLDGPLPEVLSHSTSENSDAFSIDQNRYAHIVDREGSLWLGDAKGVHRFSYSPLIKLEFPNQELAQAYALAPDEAGVVWISAGNGNDLSHLYRVANGKPEQRKSIGSASVAYRASDKTLWFAGEGGLWHMVNGSLTRIDLPPDVAANARSFQTITQDQSKGMWISIQGSGLYRYANGEWVAYGGRSDLPKGVVIAFTDKLGRVWFGYTKNRLAVLEGNSVKTFGPSDGIQVGNITAIYGRGQKIWIGGEFGLQQFEDGKFYNVEAVQKEWLRGISGIIETENGDLWLNGLEGILHISRTELQKAVQGPAHQVTGERFGRREGVPGVSQQLAPLLSAIEGTDGRLWFTGTDGVVWLDPSQASSNMTPPPVSIQSISADGKGYALGQTLRLPAHTGNVQISYAAVSLLNPEAIRFRYKLQQTDKDWHEAGTSSSVDYRNLPPGTYHFVVDGSDTNGVWSADTAAVEFTILPAFYQTGWFRSLCAAVFIALLWAAHRFRIRQLQHQFDITLEARVGERTRIARDLHDTLLQSAHGVLLQFQAVSLLLPGRPSEAKKQLDRAIDKTSAFITEARDQVQGLRTSTVQTNDLAIAISTLGEERVADATNPRPVEFHVAVEGETRNLHPIVRDEIYKIAVEALRNAFRHAEPQRVEVELRYDDAQFRLRVRDDGKGIDPAILAQHGAEGHYGLPGMRERAAGIGGKLTVWSAVNEGTEVELLIPSSAAYPNERSSWVSRKFVRKMKA